MKNYALLLLAFFMISASPIGAQSKKEIKEKEKLDKIVKDRDLSKFIL